MCEFIQSSNSFTQLRNSIYLKKRSERNYKLYVTLKFHSGMNSQSAYFQNICTNYTAKNYVLFKRYALL